MHDPFFHSDDSLQVYRGPANWFSMSVPRTVQMDQTEAFLELTPIETGADVQRPKDPWSMTVYAAWVESENDDVTPSRFDPSQLFPEVIQSRRGTALEISSSSRTWHGTSRSRADSWWKRVARKGRSYAWTLWVIERGPIFVVASLQSAQGHALESTTVSECQRILESIEFADDLAKPPELFRKEVLKLADRHFPLLNSEAVGAFAIRIAESEINLSNFYRTYIAQPARLRDIVLPGLTTMVRLQEWGPDQIMPPLNDVSERVMPMLYSETEAENGMEGFIQLPWVGGLSIMFVLDEDDTYRFVHARMLEKWGMTVDELHELALDNLNQYAQEHPLEVTVVGEDEQQRMLVPVSACAYNSSRLLGDQLHQRLRELLGPELILGIPNRDFFVAVSMAHPGLISQVRQRVIEDFKSMHHPLTSRLLVLSADGVSEYCD